MKPTLDLSTKGAALSSFNGSRETTMDVKRRPFLVHDIEIPCVDHWKDFVSVRRFSRRYLEQFFAAEDAVPHVVARPRAALLRMLLAFGVEVERDLGVDADAKVAVHDALLVHQIPAAAEGHPTVDEK